MQVEPQLIPAGVLLTVPLPWTVTLKVGEVEKFAVTEVLLLSASVHALVPLQAPLQPPKLEFADGVAVKVTCVPDEKLAVQVEPQLIPAGVLVTVPEPFPLGCTVSWTEPGFSGAVWAVPPPQPTSRPRPTQIPSEITALENMTRRSPTPTPTSTSARNADLDGGNSSPRCLISRVREAESAA